MALVNINVAKAISSLFGTERGSDVVIRFMLQADKPAKQVSQEDEPAAKRQRLAQDAPAIPAVDQPPCFSEELLAHSFVLEAASLFFRTKLSTEVGRAQDGDSIECALPAASASSSTPQPPATATARPVISVLLDCKEEVPAARAAIAFAYTGRVESCSIREALEVRRQAGFLQIDGCAEQCFASVADKLVGVGGDGGGGRGAGTGGAGGGSGGIAAMQAPPPPSPPVLELYSCEELWPDPEEEPAFAAILATAKPQLVRHFGDALAVLNTPVLRLQLLELPAAGIEALLESQEFGTDSESSVLLLLAAWMKDNYAQTDAATRERLCRQVRLVQLSRPYLAWILPALAVDHQLKPDEQAGWFPINMMEANFLANYARADAEESSQLASSSSGVYDVKTPWYDAKPRPQCLVAGGRAYAWSFAAAELEQELDALQPEGNCFVRAGFDHGQEAVIARGLEWYVRVRVKHGASTSGTYLLVTVSEVFKVRGSLFRTKTLLGGGGNDAVAVTHRWRNGQREGVVNRKYSSDRTIPFGSGRGRSTRLPLQQQAAAGAGGLAAWAEYLHEGKMTGTLTLLPPSDD